MSVLSALHTARIPVLGFVIVGISWGGFAAYVPELKAQLGAGDAAFGLLMLGQAFGLLLAMWLAPRFDRRYGARAMQFAAVAMALSWFLPGLIVSPLIFVPVLCLLGITSGLLDILMNARVSALESRHARTLMNAAHGMFSVGYLVAALVSAGLRHNGVPPVAAFAGFACVSLILAAFLWMEVEPDEPDDPAAPVSRKLPWIVTLCGFIVLVAFMSEATVEAWSALHIERTLGGSAAEGALGPAMLGLTMAVGRLGGQALTDRLPVLPLLIGASILSAAGAVIAALAPVPAVAWLGFGVLGLGVSVIGPLGLALVGRVVTRRQRTEAIARAAVMGFSGFFFAPVLMGLASEVWGLRVAYAGVAGLLLLAIPLALVVMRYPATSQARP